MEVAVDLDDGVEGHGPPREVLEQVDRVLDDAYPVELQVGVDVRHGARPDAPAAGGDPPELLAAVADVDVEARVVEREEVRVADADLERGGDSAGDGGARRDGDVREAEACEGDVREVRRRRRRAWRMPASARRKRAARQGPRQQSPQRRRMGTRSTARESSGWW